MTTTRYFRWDDPGAPAVTGQVGSGIAWLKACLVGDGSGVAYGTGGDTKMAAGWSLEFEDVGNHVAVFRNSVAAGGSGCYLRVDDNGTGVGGAREMLVRLYGAMTDVNTGTDETPTAAQLASSIVWRKSISLDGTSRQWVLVADELTCIPAIWAGHEFLGGKWGFLSGYAGDYIPAKAGQALPCCIAGAAEQSSSSTYGPVGAGVGCWRGAARTDSLWIMRSYSGAVGPISCSVPLLFSPSSGTSGMGASVGIANPAPGSNQSLFHSAQLFGDSTIMGKLRGIVVPACNFVDAVPFTEIALDQTGAIGVVVKCGPISNANNNENYYGRILVECTSEWSQ